MTGTTIDHGYCNFNNIKLTQTLINMQLSKMNIDKDNLDFIFNIQIPQTITDPTTVTEINMNLDSNNLDVGMVS